MKYAVGKRELEFGTELGEMRDASGRLGDPRALRQQMDEDGYLLLRGLHPRERVLKARRAILEFMQQRANSVAPGTDLMEAAINPAHKPVRLLGNPEITHHPDVLAVIEGAPVFEFFAAYFGERAITFDYKWLRDVGHGGFTGAHVDNVYMGRGSSRLLTCWTPLGDIPIEQGTLCVCEASHRLPGFAKLRDTYGRMDVDRDRVPGWLTSDPLEVTRSFGGRWVTAHMRAGDVVVMSMFTLHGSTNNTTQRWRISCDTRFQPASDPTDDRWVGAAPAAHDAPPRGQQKSMAVARAEWGI
jgi:hypothetical protein